MNHATNDYYTHICDLIDNLHAIGQIPMLWSAPGYGKTSLIQALIRKNGGHVQTLRGGGKTPEDFTGLPMTEKEPLGTDTLTTNARPAWHQDLVQRKDTTNRNYLFIDELTLAGPDVQSVIQDILDRTTPTGPIPDNVRIILAGNDRRDVPAAFDLSPAITSRITHLEFRPPADSWVDAMRHGFPDGRGGRGETNWGRKVVADFIDAYPNYLYDRGDHMDHRYGWPTPRTWTHVGDLVNQLNDTAIPRSLVRESVAGTVGGEAGDAFLDYLEEIDEMLGDGRASAIPDFDPVGKYSLLDDVYRGVVQIGALDAHDAVVLTADIVDDLWFNHVYTVGDILDMLNDLGLVHPEVVCGMVDKHEDVLTEVFGVDGLQSLKDNLA